MGLLAIEFFLLFLVRGKETVEVPRRSEKVMRVRFTPPNPLEPESDPEFPSDYGLSNGFDVSGDNVNVAFQTLEYGNRSQQEDYLFVCEYGADVGEGGDDSEDDGVIPREGLSDDDFACDADERMQGPP
jgi:hypothetical protein